MPKTKQEADVADEHQDDGHLPGKNRNSFLVFQAEYRAELKQKHPDLAHADVQAKISEKWNKMDAEHKHKYEVLAAKEFVEYVRKLAEQKASHPELFDRSNAKANKAAGKRRGPGITGYILYVKERMSSLKAARPELKQTDLTREIGKEWKEMSEERKAVFNATAKKQKEELLAQEAAESDAPAAASPEKKRKQPDDDGDKATSKAKKAKTEEAPKETKPAPKAAADKKKEKAADPKKEKEAAKPAATPSKKDNKKPVVQASESEDESSVSGSQRSSQRATKGKGGRK